MTMSAKRAAKGTARVAATRRPTASASAPPVAASDVSAGRLASMLGFRLRRVQNYLSRSFQDVAREHNLRAGSVNALAMIEANPGISQSEVARQIGQDASVAAALLDDLEARGWLTRRRLPHNRRRYSIEITPAGGAMLDALLARIETIEGFVRSVVSDADLDRLKTMLDNIFAACLERN